MRSTRRRSKSASFMEKQRRKRSINSNERDVMRIVFWTCVLLLSAGFGIFSQIGEKRSYAPQLKGKVAPSKPRGGRHQEQNNEVRQRAHLPRPLQYDMDRYGEGDIPAAPPQPISNGGAEDKFEPKPWKPAIASKGVRKETISGGGKWDGMDGYREGDILAAPPQPISNGGAEEKFEPKPWKPGSASKVVGKETISGGGKWDGMDGYREGDVSAAPPQPISNGGAEEKVAPKPWKPGIASKVGGKDNISEGGGSEEGGKGGDSEIPGLESEGAIGNRDPAEAVELSYAVGSSEAGPIEKFLSEGNKFPVVLLTCNRAALLEQTIKSLRQVRGMDMDRVMVLQDGSDAQVAAVVEAEGLYLKQNIAVPSLRGGPRAGDGGMRIAMHYKFSLDHAFEKEPEAPGVIIVEDDLLLSPDFLEYFEANAPVLERDSNTLVLSAWNDNGYRGRVSNKSELKRTPYFPGLGWLLSRQLYDELGSRWPRLHWDHWLRDSKQHKGRECVFPEVPRTYHNGIKGTFMNQNMHDKLFKDIDYNTDASFEWPSPTTVRPAGVPPPYAQALYDNYERRMEARIRAARHINDLDDLPQTSSKGNKAGGGEIVFWYSLTQVENLQTGTGWGRNGPPFSALSEFFGIWHEYSRTEHKGMHSFRYDGDSHVMLINAAQSPYVTLKPVDLKPATMDHLRGFGVVGGHQDGRRALQTVPADEPNVSCDDVCANKGMECFQQGFGMLNSCSVLTEIFSCSSCSKNYGPDQPCYVEQGAPASNLPGQCLVSSNPSDSTCSAKHEVTLRLCPCMPSG